MRRWLALCSLAAGCGVQLEPRSGPNPNLETPDAPIGSQPDAAPVCSNGRVVYLNFEGATLAAAAQSDATQNRASWMQISSGTAPKYKAAATNRDQQIQVIVDGVRGQLASFPITVVTQRPAAGPYVMIVYGGVYTQVGSRYTVAVNTLDCNDVMKSDLAWISDNVSPPQHVVNVSLGAIGFGLGLTATTDPLDCMCGWDNNCSSNDTVQCKLSQNIQRDPTARQLCTGVTTQNEPATFDAAFCK